MNLKALALVSVIGLSAPAITEVAFTSQSVSAMPTDFVRVGGTFVDANQEWVIRLYVDEFGAYTYEGENTKTKASITLKSPQVSREEQAYIYTFKNGGYSYKVIYNPANEKSIALYVFNPRGRVILTREMTRDWDV
ncbi:MAG: hypothetical protein AAFX80_02110 [Cyanobacteria bacterium J06639_18]